MENAGYIALSRQVSVARSIDVIANNIANISTTGFKGHKVMFDEYLQENKAQQQNSFEMVNDFGEYMDLSNGPLLQTGNPFDLALRGEAFFKVETPAGERFTRNGEFQLNAAGELVTDAGYPVVSDGGAPIVIPTGAVDIKITDDGTVFNGQTVLGKVGSFEFENPQELKQVGNNMFSYENQQGVVASENATIVQGALEKSNITPIMEITELIKLSRKYQSSQKIIQQEHERQRGAIQKIAQQ